tara:strand:- start:1216 stop:1362 length:147 start_codon:yes stop_codon:yes gene_type:complete
MKEVTVEFKSELTFDQINNILEKIFYDGEYFDEFENIDWNIKLSMPTK